MVLNYSSGGAETAISPVVAIQLSIGCWPGQVKLNPADLGLTDQDIPEIVRLGAKRLYPEETRKGFSKIGMAARNWLTKWSYAYLVDSVRAIPVSRLVETTAKLTEFRQQYNEAADMFAAEYYDIQNDWRKNYPDLWPTLAGHYPPAGVVRSRFHLSWTVFNLTSPEVPAGVSSAEAIKAFKLAQEDIKKKYTEFVSLAVADLRQKVADTVAHLMAKLESGDLGGRTLGSIRRLDTWFEELNIFGDSEVAAAIQILRTSINGTDADTILTAPILAKQISKMAQQVIDATKTEIESVSVKYRRLIDLS